MDHRFYIITIKTVIQMIHVPDEVAYNGTKKSRHWFLTKANPAESLEEFTDMAR